MPPRGHCRQLKGRFVRKWFDILSPPFEGGVAGIIDFLIVTNFISRPGWLIYSFLFTFISMKNKNLFNRKDLKSNRLSLRNRSTLVKANEIKKVIDKKEGSI